MSAPADVFTAFVNLMGSLICHQLPSRTIYAGGLPLPVCARDTGIYLGIFASSAFILFSGRMSSDKPPRLPAAILLCMLMLPMMVDGAGSYLGAYETNNTARLLTGALFGVSIPFFLVPAANFKLNAGNNKEVLKSLVEPAAIVAAVVAVCILILRGLVPYIVLSSAFVVSFLFLIGRISYTIIARSFKVKVLYRYMLSTGATVCILAGMYTFSSLVLQPLKAVFLR